MTFRVLLNGGLNLRQQLTIDKMEFSFHNAVCFPYTTTLNTGILKWLYIIFNGAKHRQEPAAPGISLVPPLKTLKLKSEMELSQELKGKK